MVWDTVKKLLIKKLQISYLQVKEIAVNPEGSQVAVVETDSVSSFMLSLWDLKSGKKLFTHTMDGLPLFIKFSPSGKYLIYSKTDWNSLIFLDTKKGYEIPLISDDYGIVSSLYITASEKTLMFYSLSGNIQYWNLTNGKLKINPIETRRDLKFISMTQDGLLMTASDSSNLYLISLQTGETLYTESLSNILYSSISPSGNELIILQSTDTANRLDIWNIRLFNGKARLVKNKSIDFTNDIVPEAGFSVIDSKVYLSGSKGEIISININNEQINIFSKNIMASISDLNLLNGKLILATDKSIISLRSNFFINSSVITNKSDVVLQKYPNPYQEATGIVSDNYNFYIYPMDISKGELKKMVSGIFLPFSANFSSPIVSAEFSNGKFITLEKDGTCRIITSSTGESIFAYSSFGINSLKIVYKGDLIAGKNRTAFLKSPLLHINSRTEEVVPIRESSIIIFKMDYDSITRTLYTLGYEEHKSGLRTVLKSHSGKDWELTDTIMSYPGEDQAGTFVVDETKSRIYISIGSSGLVMYGWNGFTNMEKSNHIPKKLYVYKNLLISLNIDSSLSIWDTGNGKLILTFYLFKTDDWIALGTNNSITLSDNSLRGIVH